MTARKSPPARKESFFVELLRLVGTCAFLAVVVLTPYWGWLLLRMAEGGVR